MRVLQVCVQDFCEELEYWGLNDLHLEPCCQHTYYRARSVRVLASVTASFYIFYSSGGFYPATVFR